MARPDDEGSSLYSGFTSPTVKLGRTTDERVKATVPYAFEEPRTQMYRGGVKPAVPLADDDPMLDPCVGWVVIIKGCGRGAALRLSWGSNAIGRDPNDPVCLNFGDGQISRNAHACLICDPLSGESYLEPRTGARNLTYIEKDGQLKPVLTPVQLTSGDVFMVGETKLMFWPFVFDWKAEP